MKIKLSTAICSLLLGTFIVSPVSAAVDESQPLDFAPRTYHAVKISPEVLAASKLFAFDSGLDFEYPDAVRGIFVTAHSAGGARFEQLVELVDTTDLNAMVIDVKEDFGHLTYEPKEGTPLAALGIGEPYIKEPRAILER